MFKEIHACRICGNSQLVTLFNLGHQALTGVFPRSVDEEVERVPTELIQCTGQGACGLVQLRHSGAPEQMYGDNYGYRSGLNASMVQHLRHLHAEILGRVELQPGDVVLDIGSNDATLLSLFSKNLDLIGMDPTGRKFQQYYPEHVRLIPSFFSRGAYQDVYGSRKARIITSIAMFYDLEHPQQFVDDIASILSSDGVWVLEQSYLPSMLAANAYDTICHEHLEYYALSQIQWLVERAGMKIVDVSLNASNGGSFRVTVSHQQHPVVASPAVVALLEQESQLKLLEPEIYQQFRERILGHRTALQQFLRDWRASGKTIFGMGASTKGNVLLQFCGITAADLPCIAEVNEQKFGCVTPGTRIPIVSQALADERCPDAYLVLPWHFRKNIVERCKAYLGKGGTLVFPLPELDVVTYKDVS